MLGHEPRDEPKASAPGVGGPRVILAGVDGSNVSLRALAYAAGMARREHARLVCVYVNQPPATPAYVPEIACYQAGSSPSAEIRHQVVDECRAWGTRAWFLTREGDPFDQLAVVAGELSADMIVVGASTSLAHRLAGSLGARLAHRRRWPVTIVP